MSNLLLLRTTFYARVLDVRGKLCAWNAYYLTTISKFVLVYKHHRTSIFGGTAIFGILTVYIYSTHGNGARVFEAHTSKLLIAGVSLAVVKNDSYHFSFALFSSELL